MSSEQGERGKRTEAVLESAYESDGREMEARSNWEDAEGSSAASEGRARVGKIKKRVREGQEEATDRVNQQLADRREREELE